MLWESGMLPLLLTRLRAHRGALELLIRALLSSDTGSDMEHTAFEYVF